MYFDGIKMFCFATDVYRITDNVFLIAYKALHFFFELMLVNCS